jgi:hypothetical protein
MKKGRWQATPKTSNACNSISIRGRIKAVIVSLAVWGLIPPGAATWLLRRLHLEAE